MPSGKNRGLMALKKDSLCFDRLGECFAHIQIWAAESDPNDLIYSNLDQNLLSKIVC
jgi:hypothetical protein